MGKKIKKEKSKKKPEFSKVLLIQESALIWIITLSLISLAFYCIKLQYFGELPWIAAMISFPWTAYGVSQACYYRKSMKENIKDGIKFETVLRSPSIEEDIYYQDQNFDQEAQG